MWPEKLMKGWLVPTINLLFCKDSIFHDCEMVIMPCAMINKTDLLGNLPECLWYCLRQCQHFPEQIFQPKISHFRTNIWVFFTLFPKITQVCVKVNCYTILCKTDEVFTQSNVGVLTFYTMLCKNVNLYIGLCNDWILWWILHQFV